MLVLLKEVLRNMKMVSDDGGGGLHYYNLCALVLEYCVKNIPNSKIKQLVRPLMYKCAKVNLSYLGYQITQIHDMTIYVLSELSKSPIDVAVIVEDDGK